MWSALRSACLVCVFKESKCRRAPERALHMCSICLLRWLRQSACGATLLSACGATNDRLNCATFSKAIAHHICVCPFKLKADCLRNTDLKVQNESWQTRMQSQSGECPMPIEQCIVCSMHQAAGQRNGILWRCCQTVQRCRVSVRLMMKPSSRHYATRKTRFNTCTVQCASSGVS